MNLPVPELAEGKKKRLFLFYTPPSSLAKKRRAGNMSIYTLRQAQGPFMIFRREFTRIFTNLFSPQYLLTADC
jgi:hypothetical protein